MNSYRPSKLNSERPGSSPRAYDYDSSNYVPIERRSKIPKMPKRTYSWEGKKSCCLYKKTNTRNRTSTTSMIPRLEWKKQSKKTPTVKHRSKENIVVETPKTETPAPLNSTQNDSYNSFSKSKLPLETKLNEDLSSFKSSVLRIPEYWTDAGETMTGILKNAIKIITKQYPTADVESFEKDIANILNATDTVKQQILMRTEQIINKANQIYSEKGERNPAMADEDLKMITRKISDLKNEVSYRKNVFGDLLKYGSEMKELLELEKSLKHKVPHRDNKDYLLETGKNEIEEGHIREGKKYKVGTENTILHTKETDKHSLQSCGDIVRQGTKILLETDARSEISRPSAEDKGTQTLFSWFEELRTREKDLKDLNKQITELHQLCRDHISRFKNFNFQIKMRGICNKSQHSSPTKDVFVHKEEALESLEKKNNMTCSNMKDVESGIKQKDVESGIKQKDVESGIKQKDVDLHYKEKLINQKKLLHVRDELIGMLKNRCNLEEQRRY